MNCCIYCAKELVSREVGISPLNSSLEHVIPYSLGGGDGLATRDACVGCNSILGETVDAACINQPYIVTLRQTHSIRGHSGSVPSLQLPAASVVGNEPATMILPHEGAATFKHKPIVIRQDETFGERLLVVGDRTQVLGIVTGVAAKAKKRGDQTLDPSSGLPMDIPASNAAADRETFGEYEVRFPIDLDALRRGLIKMAFGFAHLTLGWKWTGSPHARRIRAVARGAGSGEDIKSFVMAADPNIRSILPMGNAGATDHFIALIPSGNNSQVVVSLFSDPLLSIAVKLDVTVEILEAAINANDRMMVMINHQTRQATWVGFVEFMEHFLRARIPPSP